MTPELDAVHVGDCLDLMRSWPARFVHSIVTSPPYWGLRDYKVPPRVWGGDQAHAHVWGEDLTRHRGGPAGSGAAVRGRDQSARDAAARIAAGAFCACGAWRGCLGLEPTPEMFVAHLVEILREARRVLRDDGTLWLNIGDSYSAGGMGGHQASGTFHGHAGDRALGKARKPPTGYKPKDLVGVPWMTAFALRADGWYLRQEIIWHKPNPMPESVEDRCTKAHEQLFLLSKRPKYFYDAEAIKEPASWNTHSRGAGLHPKAAAVDHDATPGARPKANSSFSAAVRDVVEDRNKRSVWTVPTTPYHGAHFATFPPALIVPCVQAGTSEGGVCATCGAPRARKTERVASGHDGSRYGARVVEAAGGALSGGVAKSTLGSSRGAGTAKKRTTGWKATCAHYADTAPAIVLDPFMGAGTTALVAARLNRRFVGCELNPANVELSRERVFDELVQGKIL